MIDEQKHQSVFFEKVIAVFIGFVFCIGLIPISAQADGSKKQLWHITEPTKPTEPTQPTEPSWLRKPTNLTEPTKPTEPTQPTEPSWMNFPSSVSGDGQK
jgi:hypothetical protein